ncbi:mandelate racemase/muconate lactonizing enzyme family protein [Mesorhizobium sp. M0701]|uniref:mandelate racemase/muconate lactonizing enzyme family protein n=1 Tax=Mesorhizobium sp. M0701 TaxID=2956989 RepID=UPI00333997F3
MKITKIETMSLGEFPNVSWIMVHTEGGIVGLGETYFGSEAVQSYVHETLAPQMLGKDALRIEAHSHTLLNNYVGYKSSGAEIRGASAFDIALWDIFGKVTGQPLYQLLGGLVNPKLRAYNTCAGYRYVRSRPTWGTDNWGINGNEGPYEDLEGFLTRADEVAESLIDEGYFGMKVWPFDFAAEKTRGTDISVADLKKGMVTLEKIRERVGDKIEIFLEMHGLWQLPAALKIANAVAPLRPYWFEDPIKPNNINALRQFRENAPAWTAASETLATRWSFRELLEQEATDVVIADLGWSGGISEARKVVSMTEAYNLPFAPHDCSGPVQLAACVHLCAASPNALTQEVVRAFYHGWYTELVEDLPELAGGFISPLEKPGIGVELKPGLRDRADVRGRTSDWNP